MDQLEKLYILAKLNYNFADKLSKALSRYICQDRDIEFEDPEAIIFYEALTELIALADSVIHILKKKGVVYHPKMARQYKKEKPIVFIVFTFIYEVLRNKELLNDKSYLEYGGGLSETVRYMISCDWTREWREYFEKNQTNI